MRRRTPILLVLLLLPLLAPPGAALGDEGEDRARLAELLKEFRKVQKSPDWQEIKRRRDLVVELSGLDFPPVVPLLYEVFTEDREQLCRIPAMIGLGARGHLPVLKAMVHAALKDRNDVFRMILPRAFEACRDPEIGPWLVKNVFPRGNDETLRAAVIESLGLLGTEAAFEPIREILAKGTREVRVDYEALIALGRIGGERAVPEIARWLEHDERFLREGAVVALGETGSEAAVDRVLPLVTDSFPRTQEAVAELIGRRKAEAAIPSLVHLLRGGRLRVMDTARNVLETMTGESFGIDADAWERWYELKRKGQAPPPEKRDERGSVATYYGMRIFSDRVLFILDVSGSMKAGEPPRIDTAREELAKTLDQLSEKTLVNIVGFSGSPMWWRDSEVEAGKKNVASAKEFVEKLSPGGGTNVYDTFEEALEKNRLVDTIYFLGDGSPSVGKVTEQEEILARIAFMNRFRKVRINTIALVRGEVARFGGRNAPGLGRGRSISGERAYDEEEAARFLARLAEAHGGTHVLIDD